MTSEQKSNKEPFSEWKEELPLIPIRNIVIFPQMIVPLFIGRTKSIKALDDTLKKEKLVVFTLQKNEEVEEPQPKDLCTIGTVAEIVQVMTLPDETTKVLVEGICRIKIEKYVQESPYYKVLGTRLLEPEGLSAEAEALIRSTIKLFEKYVKLNKRIPPETLMSIINVDKPGRLADLIASYLTLKSDEKQLILESTTVEKRLQRLSEMLKSELEVLEKASGKSQKTDRKSSKRILSKREVKGNKGRAWRRERR